MTFSCPSAFAAATRASIPPPAWADAAVAQFPLLEPDEEPPAAALLLELPDPLLQPAASMMLASAAPAATIALVAPTISSICPPDPVRAGPRLAILARQVHMVASQVERNLTCQ